MADEARLLASVGGTVASVDTYESSVLQQATLDTAPQLTGIGLPDRFEAILPTYNGRTKQWDEADVPHIRTVLSKTRSALASEDDESSNESLVLRFKEQILLSVLMQKLPPAALPVHPAREAALEKKWSSKLKSPALSKSDSGSDKATSNVQNGNESVLGGNKLGPIKRRAFPSNRKESSDVVDTKSMLEPDMRKKRRRITMMERKKIQGESLEDDDSDSAKSKELLRQRRHERLKLKRKRRKRWEEQEEEELQDSSEEEIEFEPQSDENEYKTGITEKVASEPPEKTNKALCPICQQSIPVGANTLEADAALSKHMDHCQRQRRRTRRNTVSNEHHSTATPAATATPATKTSAKPPAKKRPVVRQRYRSLKPALDDMEEFEYEDRVDEWIESGVHNMRDMSERDQNESPPGAEEYPGGLVIPAWMNDRLFSYQRTGLRWMWELHTQGAGGIVGDEMGLGKTVQVCSFLGAMASCRKLDSILIVAPATMLVHWLTELKTWAPGLRRILVHKSGEADGLSRNVSTKLIRKLEKWLHKARADCVNEPIDDEDLDDFEDHSFCGTAYVVVTTYENVRKTPDIWTTHAWSYVVLDEGQRIRNPDADVTLACKRLRTPQRLLLSGTPIQNDLRELWSLFDFVFPGRLGTLPAFEVEFADPIKRGGYTNASPMQVQLAYRCALVLRDLINPYLLRRQKKDIKEVNRMPGKTEQVLFCRLSARQRAIYEAYLRSDEVRNILRGSPQLLRSITVLRKICNHPDLVCGPDASSFESFVRNGYVKDSDIDLSSEDEFDDTEEESTIERSGKLEVLAKILPLWYDQGHRVLIFCQWRKMLSIIERFTQSRGWKFGRMDGNTSVATRQHLVDTFNTDESYFGMLLTTRTGGVGLNLTGADRIILYDPDWNPQTDAQARERAWRFGQKNSVTVYRLITSGTVEEKIYQRQIFKTALSNKILQDPRQRRLFSQRDLRDLFSLKADVGSVKDGGQGLTETGRLTRGGGVVDPDMAETPDPSPASDSKKQNNDTLETVMKSKGLAGVFDHDFVDYPASRKTASAIEMEQHAKRVARDAAKALRLSTSQETRFQPTWTGSSETKPLDRFGGNKVSRSSVQSQSKKLGKVTAETGFGGGTVAGVVKVESSGPAASGDLLSHLRERGSQVSSAASSSGSSQIVATGDTGRYADLMNSVRNFVIQHGGRKGGGPTTEEILNEFDSVPHRDAAIFRRLLNSVAQMEGGTWRLKE